MFLFSQGVNPIKMPHPRDLSKLSPSNVTAGAGSPVDCELCEDREFSVQGCWEAWFVCFLRFLFWFGWLTGFGLWSGIKPKTFPMLGTCPTTAL